jgi:hypothetical protein
MKETRGRYQKKENDLDIARAVLKKKKSNKILPTKKENCSMARARLLTPNVVIYSNKETRDTQNRGAYTSIFYGHNGNHKGPQGTHTVQKGVHRWSKETGGAVCNSSK